MLYNMKTKRDFLRFLIKEKNYLIFKETEIEIYKPSDWGWFYSLTTKDIHDIYKNIIKSRMIFDGTICINCRYVDVNVSDPEMDICEFCEYGERHGFCNDQDSTYHKVIKKLKNRIVNFIGVKNASRLVKWNSKII